MDVRLADCGKRQSDYIYVLSPGLQDCLGGSRNSGCRDGDDELNFGQHLQNVLRLGEGFVAVVVAGSNGSERQKGVPDRQLALDALYPLILVFRAQWTGDNRELASIGKQAFSFIGERLGNSLRSRLVKKIVASIGVGIRIPRQDGNSELSGLSQDGGNAASIRYSHHDCVHMHGHPVFNLFILLGCIQACWSIPDEFGLQFSRGLFGPGTGAHKIWIALGFWHDRNFQAMRLYALARRSAGPGDQAGMKDRDGSSKDGDGHNGSAPKSDSPPQRDASLRANAFLALGSMGLHGPQLLETDDGEQKRSSKDAG